ncbi:uncharacterized protein [Rutidosis leptorrhynchoides]|uniref:uncharacterized protein n=1 Tax=Rutidosis leptorrhynchoides TaxID=125765 RepID=UPI003A991123
MAEWLGYVADKYNSLFRLDMNQNSTIWEQNLSPNGSFSINALTKLLTKASLNSGPFPARTLRNHLVPLKVELFVWRARQLHLPTRIELEKRGMDLGSVRGPLCDNDLESVEHSLFRCNVAFEIWVKIYNWWNIGPLPSLTMTDAFLGHGI